MAGCGDRDDFIARPYGLRIYGIPASWSYALRFELKLKMTAYLLHISIIPSTSTIYQCTKIESHTTFTSYSYCPNIEITYFHSNTNLSCSNKYLFRPLRTIFLIQYPKRVLQYCENLLNFVVSGNR